MLSQQIRKGSVQVVIIVGLVVVILGGLGVIFYQNFIAQPKTNTTSTSTTSATTTTIPAIKPKSTIEVTSGSDMNHYINNEYGFEFDFPKQAYGSTGCHSTTKWYDNYGKLVDAPVTSFVVDNGMTDMTVIDGPHSYTIAQKRAPLFTMSVYGTDKRQYDSACEMVDVTQDRIDQVSDTIDLSTERRSWQVYKIDTEQEIATLASQLNSLPQGTNIKSTSYALGQLSGGRQTVTYSYEFKDSNVGVYGTGATKTWYYPAKKLLVHIGLGQSVSFMKAATGDASYIDQIVDSFKLTQ